MLPPLLGISFAKLLKEGLCDERDTDGLAELLISSHLEEGKKQWKDRKNHGKYHWKYNFGIFWHISFNELVGYFVLVRLIFSTSTNPILPNIHIPHMLPAKWIDPIPGFRSGYMSHYDILRDYPDTSDTPWYFCWSILPSYVDMRVSIAIRVPPNHFWDFPL